MPDPDWPKRPLLPGDRLIDGKQPDWQHNACIGPQLPQSFGMDFYSDGFRNAARQLVVELVKGQRAEFALDVIVYPVLFLYRHHFELLLKLLIVSSRELLNQPTDSPHGHKLLALWKEARPLIEQCFPETDWSQNDIAESLFAELEQVDPLGQAARYPVDTKGAPSFEGIPLLNVRHFSDTAERLSDYLSSVLFGIDITEEQRREWEADMMSMYGE